MPTIKTKKPTLNTIPPCEEWGVEKQGAFLHSDPKVGGFQAFYGTYVIDIENNQDGSCAGIGLSKDGRNILFFSSEFVKTVPKDAFKDTQLAGHNVKYDVQMLRKWGFNVSPDQIVWDTQLAEYVKDSTRFKYGLKALVTEYFGVSYPDYKLLTGKGKASKSIGEIDPVVLANYNGCDVLFTYRLYQKQLAEMTEQQISYLEHIELPTMRVLLEMEERGVQIDADYIRSLDNGFAQGIERVDASLRSVSDGKVNFNSPKQVGRFLMDKAGLRLKSTAAEELKNHAGVPIVANLLRYRELTKLRGTYTSVLVEKAAFRSGIEGVIKLLGGEPPKTEYKSAYRLHARFNQTTTKPGRLSSSDPNLQNIPTRTEEGDSIRKAFIAKEGHTLIDADYSQIEPRLMAHLSQDKALKDIFLKGQDLYDSVAQLVGCDRKTAKILWLAMAYNAGAFKIAQTANISHSQAEVFLTRMKLAFPDFFYWRSKVIAQAEIEQGVSTLLGRFITLDKDFAHLAPNYKVQGSAAEIMKLAIMATRPYQPVMSVHDEMLFEAPVTDYFDAHVQAIKSTMESVIELSVPLVCEVGVGASWSAAKQ